jgi:hypothetical protein
MARIKWILNPAALAEPFSDSLMGFSSADSSSVLLALLENYFFIRQLIFTGTLWWNTTTGQAEDAPEKMNCCRPDNMSRRRRLLKIGSPLSERLLSTDDGPSGFLR